MKNEYLNVAFLDPNRDTAHCAVCGAQNAKPRRPMVEPECQVRDIYEVRIGNYVQRLCRSCLLELQAGIGPAVAESDKARQFPEGQRKLLEKVLGSPAPEPDQYAGQITRLRELVSALPRRGMLDAVVDEYFDGAVPGRPCKDPSRRKEEVVDVAELLERAIGHLAEPSRKGYIASGSSDLKSRFPADVLPWLNKNGLYVLDDLKFLSDQAILDMPGTSPRKISLLYQAREEYVRNME